MLGDEILKCESGDAKGESQEAALSEDEDEEKGEEKLGEHESNDGFGDPEFVSDFSADTEFSLGVGKSSLERNFRLNLHHPSSLAEIRVGGPVTPSPVDGTGGTTPPCFAL